MNGWVMAYLALALRREGFAAHAVTYRTMRDTLEDHLARLVRRVAELDAPRVHLIGHSLGGVIALKYLQRDPDKRVRRAVLLGTPASGCRAAADLGRSAAGRLLLGRSMEIWSQPVDTSLDPRFEVGAIAGARPFGIGSMVTRLPEPNDGVVCLDETRFEGLRDHLTLPLGHSVLLVSGRVARHCAAFLRRGRFG